MIYVNRFIAPDAETVIFMANKLDADGMTHPHWETYSTWYWVRNLEFRKLKNNRSEDEILFSIAIIQLIWNKEYVGFRNKSATAKVNGARVEVFFF